MTVNVRPLPSEIRYTDGYELRGIDTADKFLEAIVTTYDRWGDVGPFEERMMAGVFDDSLSRHADNIKLVLGHDDSLPGVATPHEWRRADDHLSVVYKFGTHAEARKVAQMAEERMFGGVSVGFLPGKRPGDSVWEMVDGAPRVTRHRARLLHIGLVTTPANADAEYAMRSIGVPEDLVLTTPRLDETRALLARLQANRIEVPK